MEIYLLLLIPVVFYVLAKIVLIPEKRKKEKKLEEVREIQAKLNSAQFTISQEFIGKDGNSRIAIDESKCAVCLISRISEGFDFRFLKYKDMLSSELHEDGETVTSTSRSSQIGGALLGGIAFGAAGAIIGGLSGNTVSKKGMIERIDLRLVVNDTKNPCHDLNFLNVVTEKKSSRYETAIKQARHWHGLLTVIINKADQEDQADKKSFCAIKPEVPEKQIELEVCANCGETIGRLEQAYIFEENIICSNCKQKLWGQD